MCAHQIVHDRGGARQRADGDVDGACGFQTAHKFVVIDDRRDVERVDVGGQLGGVVGVHNNAVLTVFKSVDDLGFGCIPTG